MQRKLAVIAASVMLLSACLGMPDTVKPVEDFELNRYLGKWYEIARLDHSFERGMEQVTAQYSLREDGGVDVLNRGFLSAKNQWSEARGRAYFVDNPQLGYLKVSFFGPFYGSYVVFELDKKDYRYAFVSGPDLSYLWLLSRTPEVAAQIKADFLAQAEARGFDTAEVIWVKHK